MISRRRLFSFIAGTAAAVIGRDVSVRSLDVGGYRMAPGLAPLSVGETVRPAAGIDALAVQKFLREHMPMIARQLQQYCNLNPSVRS